MTAGICTSCTGLLESFKACCKLRICPLITLICLSKWCRSKPLSCCSTHEIVYIIRIYRKRIARNRTWRINLLWTIGVDRRTDLVQNFDRTIAGVPAPSLPRWTVVWPDWATPNGKDMPSTSRGVWMETLVRCLWPLCSHRSVPLRFCLRRRRTESASYHYLENWIIQCMSLIFRGTLTDIRTSIGVSNDIIQHHESFEL